MSGSLVLIPEEETRQARKSQLSSFIEFQAQQEFLLSSNYQADSIQQHKILTKHCPGKPARPSLKT
jgi:hypothetical protein